MNSKFFKIDSKSTPSSLPGICWICHQNDTPITKTIFRFPNFFSFKKNQQQDGKFDEKKESISKNYGEDSANNENNEEKSNKNEQISGISHKLADEIQKNKLVSDDKNGKIFKPCLCKGSLGNVHQECLNAWALKKYQTYINLFSENEESILFENEGVARNEFKIKCPNCKYALKYEVYEKKVFKGISSFKFDSNEKITLFLLISFQILFVYYDLRSLYYEKVEKRSLTENFLHIIYIFTVCVILSAGTFNFVDLFGREMTMEVGNMEN
jgi:RING-variant domain